MMNTRMFLLLSAMGLGCADSPDAQPLPPLAVRDAHGFPRYDEVFQCATHNSYWVDRGTQGDAAASGVGERLLDQLLVDHVRSLEIDIHRSDVNPHDFRVFHTVPGNSLCDTIAECLGELRAFHRVMPQHEVVTIIMELKDVTSSNFDATHTIEDLDQILNDELGDLLYRPKDLLVPCDGRNELSLASCVQGSLWPGLGDLRGRFVVAILGNWDAIGAQATRDWVDYAIRVDMHQRAAFPMASSWKLEWEKIPPKVAELLTQADLDQAFSQSVFLQVEDATDAHIVPFLDRNGVIRVDNAFTLDAQAAVIANGMQLVQSDTPWMQVDDRGMGQPLRPLSSGAADLVEPGERLRLATAAKDERVFAYVEEPATSSTTWETTVSSGADATAIGCIRAAEVLGDVPLASSVMVCRRKRSGRIPPAIGGAKGTPDAERVFIDIDVCNQGSCKMTSMASEEGTSGGIGDTLSVVVENQASGSSCVSVQSARSVERGLSPKWAPVGTVICVPTLLRYQGLARPAAMGTEGSVAFFATTRQEGVGDILPVRGPTFVGVIREPLMLPFIQAPLLLEDLSVP